MCLFFSLAKSIIWEDMSYIIAFGEPIAVPAGDFDDTLTAKDCNPLEEAETDVKVYVRGIGLAIDEDAELIPYSTVIHETNFGTIAYNADQKKRCCEWR